MRTLQFISPVIALLLLAGCANDDSNSKTSGSTKTASGPSLLEARKGFKTKVTPSTEKGEAVPVAPTEVFATVQYPAAVGNLAAYVSSAPSDGQKRPAIVWITGGDCNSVGDVWSPQGHDNDQSAAAFRKAGVVMMFPSLRGGNANPGVKEGFFGEVDDVLKAVDWLAKLPYVDSKRIYLGGHSTGGTLALLVAEASPRFRAVFSFGPVEDVRGYGADSGFLPFDIKNDKEAELRSPGFWLSSVKTPTWVIEGGDGNIDSLRAMKESAANLPNSSNLHFVEVGSATHFNILAPVNDVLATKVVADTGPTCNITFDESEANTAFSNR